jgi:hypothetical protein
MGKKVQIFSRDNVFNKEAVGNEKLQKLHPMAIPLLAVKLRENPKNTFLSSSVAIVTESPFKLTDKWIESINKWVESVIAATMLDEPDLKINQRYNFGPIKISKIQEPNYSTDFPMPAIICQDDNGWKFYFKTTKAYEFQIGNKICFSALVASHKEGITFLSRPTKIVIWTEPENE